MMGLVWSLVEGIDGQKWARGRSHKIKNGPQKSRMLVRGSGDQVHLFSAQVLHSRKRTDAFTSEGGSTGASSLPLAPLPPPPRVLLYPSLLAFVFSCSLPQFFLLTFSVSLLTFFPSLSLSPLLSFFLHLSFSYLQSSRLMSSKVTFILQVLK